MQQYMTAMQKTRIDEQMSRVPLRKKVWFDPTEGIYYQGSTGDKYSSNPLCNKGRTQIYDASMKSNLMRALGYRIGGITDDSVMSTIKAVMVLDKLLGIEFRNYALASAFQSEKTDTLTFDTDVGTKFSAQTRVLPGDVPQIQNLAVTRTTWDLGETGKNVSQIVVVDETRKKSVHDIMGSSVKNAKLDLVNQENTQLEVLLAAITAVAGADWGAMTAGVSDNVPIKDIEGAMTTISDNGFPPDTLVLHPKPWGELISNTHIRGTQEVKNVEVSESTFRIIGLPTLNIIIDAARLNTSAIVASKAAPWGILVRGPTEAAQYRDEVRGWDGYIIRQWTEAKQVIAGAAREITGIQA